MHRQANATWANDKGNRPHPLGYTKEMNDIAGYGISALVTPIFAIATTQNFRLVF